MDKVAVIGLGYVGLPVAIEFSKRVKTIGFDIDLARVNELLSAKDHTGEVSPDELKKSNCFFTSDLSVLKEANFYIVTVPTPVDEANQPDLTLIKKASEMISKHIKKGDIVVYESTVYPGCTEEICGPILENGSGLKSGIDFYLGYSPERINPGDKEHVLSKIKKVVSGQNLEVTEKIASMYGMITSGGVHQAESIRVAEAAKVIENTQRDLNIALMNELSVIFDRMEIKTQDVLRAASTKWNFLNFSPGLVGGHCIGVDPYYLTHKAQTLGYQPEVILAGRRINDSMGSFIAQKCIKLMIQSGINVVDSVVSVLGFTFKENCPDIRNTKVIDIINELKSYGVRVQVSDPVGDSIKIMEEYAIESTEVNQLNPADLVIVAVAHDQFKKLQLEEIRALYKSSQQTPILVDVKGIYSGKSEIENQFRMWSL